MNTGQMLLVLGSLMLLSLVSLTVNSMIASKTSTMLEMEADLNAISLGQSMLDEIMANSFDAVTANGTKVFDSTKFTAASSLGPSSTEATNVPLPDSLPRPGINQPPNIDSTYRSNNYYNDVDDYDGYKRIAFTTTMADFAIIDTVYYVLESNPNQTSSSQTFYKKVVVTIRHPNMYPGSVPYNPWAGKYFLQLSDVAVYRRYF